MTRRNSHSDWTKKRGLANIVVKTPEEFAKNRSTINHIVYFADKYGKVLYER